ncbi:glycosyltransferase family protein [Methylomonas albis]|uniref:Glycosyltransferase RgtA/B/C/D-like domain-containing protein n=1 Tax=Methylomonas albis TaxID=1854563 RepID=A0ABR9D0T4_9GAMM|nr:hypothetical protein [Methylomonas albis]MBD9356727.1 hypothetical protein [Methylomonas albis]
MYKIKLTAIYGHVFLCSIGLIGLVLKLIRALLLDGFFLGSQLQLSTSLFQPWQSVLSVGKREQLISYVLVMLATVLYYSISYLYIRRESHNLTDNSLLAWLEVAWERAAGYLFVVLLANVFLLAFFGSGGYYLVFLALLIWLLIFVLPAQFGGSVFSGYKSKFITTNSLMALVGVLAILPYIYYVGGGGVLENEFQDIPEQTILEDGLIVNNSEFINEHGIGGLVRYDPIGDHGMDPQKLIGEGIPIRITTDLKKWLNEADRPLRYFYSPASKQLYVLEYKEDESSQLASLFSVSSKSVFKSSKTARYSEQEWDFIRRNKSELINQSLAGHFFHHHFALIASINDYLLGKPPELTHYTYGWGNTLLIAEVLKLTGGFSFERYVHVTYLFYPVYFFILAGVAWLIFKDKNYLLLTSLMALIFFYAQGFESVRFAPGLNPIRHFLDLFALYMLFCFWRKNSLFYIVCFFLICAVSIVANKEFGLILYLSALLGLFVSNFIKPRLYHVVVLVIATILGPILWMANPTNSFGTISYVIKGLTVPDTPFAVIFVLGLFISFVAAILVITEKKLYWHLLLFWSFYSSGLLVYFVWNPIPNHIFSLGSVFAILLSLLLKVVLDHVRNYVTESTVISFFYKYLLVSLFPLVIFFFVHQLGYINYFNSHVIHKWNFKSADFESTMDPAFFFQAVNLIDQYSTGPEIYLVSKYSNILPWLSGKYNSVPYNEIALELVSEKEVNKAVKFILDRNPLYLFIDTDINRTHVGDIIDSKSSLGKYVGVANLSRDKALLIDNLRLLATPLLNNYKLVGSTPLVSVYKKN